MTVVGKPSLLALRTRRATGSGCRRRSWPSSATTPSSRCRWRTGAARFAVAVHTGIGHAESFTDLPEDVRPHLDLPDVGALAELLRR